MHFGSELEKFQSICMSQLLLSSRNAHHLNHCPHQLSNHESVLQPRHSSWGQSKPGQRHYLCWMFAISGEEGMKLPDAPAPQAIMTDNAKRLKAENLLKSLAGMTI